MVSFHSKIRDLYYCFQSLAFNFRSFVRICLDLLYINIIIKFKFIHLIKTFLCYNFKHLFGNSNYPSHYSTTSYFQFCIDFYELFTIINPSLNHSNIQIFSFQTSGTRRKSSRRTGKRYHSARKRTYF